MPTITEAIIKDLNTGNAHLRLIPYVAGTGVNFSAEAGVDFSSADELFTLENSFQLTKDAPSFSATKIDQKKKVIEQSVDKGDNWLIQGNVPSIATALMDLAFEAGAATAKAKVSASKTYTGKGYYMGSKESEYTILAESQSGNSAIMLARVKLIFSEPQHDDNSTPSYVHFEGAMLPNEAASQGDFAVLKEPAA